MRDLDLRDAEDDDIFAAAKAAGVVVMTKDSDFIDLLDRFPSPPQVIWITCGNTSNAALRNLLLETLSSVLTLLGRGEPLVEAG